MKRIPQPNKPLKYEGHGCSCVRSAVCNPSLGTVNSFLGQECLVSALPGHGIPSPRFTLPVINLDRFEGVFL